MTCPLQQSLAAVKLVVQDCDFYRRHGERIQKITKTEDKVFTGIAPNGKEEYIPYASINTSEDTFYKLVEVDAPALMKEKMDLLGTVIISPTPTPTGDEDDG